MKKVFTLTVAALALFAGCTGKKTTEQPTAEKTETAIEVKVAAVKKQSIDQNQEYTGTILPYSKNMIASQSAMRIEKIQAEVGDYVTQGQLLVKMEETNYLQAKLQLENLKVDYDRTKSLYETGGVSKQVIDQLKTQLSVTEETVANLHKNTYLLSPISGVVTNRMFDNGDITGGQPILQVQQLKPIKILLNVHEQYFPVVKPRMEAIISLDIYPNEQFKGKVNLVYPTIDAVSHTFVVEVVFDNQLQKIRPGMFARVQMNFGKLDNVVIPDKAIVKQPGTNDRYVYVLKPDNTVAYTKITLGQRLGDSYELLTGLEGTEQVVVAGITKLVNGSTVKVVD
jgi:RND family efflux transporter MFP subunit